MVMTQDSDSSHSFSLEHSPTSSLHLIEQDDMQITCTKSRIQSITSHVFKKNSVLPTWWYYANGHTMINRDRSLAKVPLLYRSRFLDALARLHAQGMAEKQSISHSVESLEELREKLQSEEVGENIQRGATIFQMHRSLMCERQSLSRRNIMSKKFNEFGIGTAKGEDGKLYMVQLFRQSQQE
jgi:hypothetical protein